MNKFNQLFKRKRQIKKLNYNEIFINKIILI